MSTPTDVEAWNGLSEERMASKFGGYSPAGYVRQMNGDGTVSWVKPPPTEYQKLGKLLWGWMITALALLGGIIWITLFLALSSPAASAADWEVTEYPEYITTAAHDLGDQHAAVLYTCWRESRNCAWVIAMKDGKIPLGTHLLLNVTVPPGGPAVCDGVGYAQVYKEKDHKGVHFGMFRLYADFGTRHDPMTTRCLSQAVGMGVSFGKEDHGFGTLLFDMRGSRAAIPRVQEAAGVLIRLATTEGWEIFDEFN